MRNLKRRVAGSGAVVTLAGSALLAAGAQAAHGGPRPGISPASASRTLSPQPGDTLTEVPAKWSTPQPATIQWFDCNRSGNNCHPIGAPGIPGSSYTVRAGDAGSRIEVWETAPASGTTLKGTTLKSAPTLVVGSPSNTSPPTISGIPQQGHTLTAIPGSWTAGPTSFGYRWFDCDRAGNRCNAIQGATNRSYKLTAGDAGSTIEVHVTATNAAGSGTAHSATTTVVAPPPPYDLIVPKHIGTIGSTLSWKFFYSPTYTSVLALMVHRALAGTKIAVGCHGVGCSFTGRSAVVAKARRCARTTGRPCVSKPGTVSLLSWFRNQRRLYPPATVIVKLTRRGFNGKEYTFRTRPRHGPQIRILCLPPGARHPRARC